MQENVFARIDGGAEELRRDTRYYWDNSKRSDSNRINLQLTLTGEAFFENESGRKAVPVGKIMLFTQRENSRYGYPATATEPYLLRYLSIDPTATATPLFNRIRRDFGAVLSMPVQSESANAFNEVFLNFSNRSFKDRYHESELITHLLTTIYRQQVEDTQLSDPTEYGYHILQNKFASPITLQDIAKQCDISREHFIRSFTKRYHKSPGTHLRKLRLEQARSMLEASSQPLETIATACGFSSANVFCRAFRHTYSTTPASHRRSHPR